ncbi:MAG: DNA-binding IclR family transcriptional regulator [Halocynthiibacter sp.]|jgi:DNA-binding IclR family transcriptional regulator
MDGSELDKPQNRNGIQVIGRAASILRALRDDPQGMSLGQIADTVGLARSTVQRIVSALQEERLVVTSGTGGIRLGPEITTLAGATKFSIADLCRPLLTDLVRSCGETADLSCLRGPDMIFLDQVAGTHRLRAISSVGDVFPLTDTANGRAVLAMMPRDRAKKLTEAEWVRRGTPGVWSEFAALLDRVEATGIAWDREEHTPGISAMGFAFVDWSGDLHAISVPVPASRFERVEKIIEGELTKLRGKVLAAINPARPS